MNKEDITRLAQEAGFVGMDGDHGALRRFAALVASAERESLRESFRVVTAAEASAAILHEREACAKLCENKETLLSWPTHAAAIRARGNHD